MTKINYHYFLFGLLTLLTSACAPPPQQVYQAPLASIPGRQIDVQRISFGSAQQIKGRVDKGEIVSGDTVIQALGTPNVITSNSDNTETWVYDKVLTEKEGAIGQNTAVQTQSSRTMMIVIKFNNKHSVENIIYRQTSY